MRAKLVRIGNSRGVRLPKAILEASGISDEVDLTVEDGRIVLMRPQRRPREGWAEAARRMVEDGDDADPFEGATGLDSWDDEEWTWPEDHPWPEESDDMTPISSPAIPREDPRSPKPARASSSRRTS